MTRHKFNFCERGAVALRAKAEKKFDFNPVGRGRRPGDGAFLATAASYVCQPSGQSQKGKRWHDIKALLPVRYFAVVPRLLLHCMCIKEDKYLGFTIPILGDEEEEENWEKMQTQAR